jgi:hypothetical protein
MAKLVEKLEQLGGRVLVQGVLETPARDESMTLVGDACDVRGYVDGCLDELALRTRVSKRAPSLFPASCHCWHPNGHDDLAVREAL